jgi:predicted RNA-binding Zn-ribbon protein involved in translation (DUF1610 family)
MTVRNPVVCISCDSKIITRTQVGHKDMQKHSFPCPTCGVKITYVLDLDQGGLLRASAFSRVFKRWTVASPRTAHFYD